MQLGAFSISLAVKDIHVSKDFYEKLGFKVFTGDIAQNWLILKNDDQQTQDHQSGLTHRSRSCCSLRGARLFAKAIH